MHPPPPIYPPPLLPVLLPLNVLVKDPLTCTFRNGSFTGLHRGKYSGGGGGGGTNYTSLGVCKQWAVTRPQFSGVRDWQPCHCWDTGKQYALHPVSERFPQRCLGNGSSVRMTNNSPLSSFQKRMSSAFSFHASPLQAICGVMSSALCLQVASQAPQHLRSSEKQATCEGVDQ